MGEKLVKALRQCRKNGNCDTCEYNTGDNADCIDTMMAESADELERLQDGYDNAIVDARYRVEQVRELQAENADLLRQLSEKSELLDKAVKDLRGVGDCCQCDANVDGSCCDMFDGNAENKYSCSQWQWRGGGEK